MKVTMVAAPFGQRGQMHIHCRRYVRLQQLAGCSVALVEHSGAISPDVAGVEHYKYPRRMRRLDGWMSSRALSFIHKSRLQPLLRSTRADVFHVQWIDERVLDVSQCGLALFQEDGDSLTVVAERLNQTLRPDDMVSRFHADEFLVQRRHLQVQDPIGPELRRRRHPPGFPLLDGRVDQVSEGRRAPVRVDVPQRETENLFGRKAEICRGGVIERHDPPIGIQHVIDVANAIHYRS